MAIKQSLSVKLGQQLKMTPQLQQAIKLLQLSSLELSQEIQAALDSNPMLEVDEEWSETPEQDGQEKREHKETESEGTTEPASDPEYGMEGFESPPEQEISELIASPIGDDIPVDSNWDDVYPQAPAPASSDNDFDPGSSGTAETLESHLLWQLNLTPFAPADRIIALAIIDAINDEGMLTATLEEIQAAIAPHAERTLSETTPDETIEEPPSLAEIEQILRRIQKFDPIGVAARDLRECLLIQLDSLATETPWLEEAQEVVRNFLDLLGSKDFAALVRQTKLTENELSQVVALIRTLQPRPGLALSDQDSGYVTPDVTVRKVSGRWLVELNPETLPKLRINNTYASWAKSAMPGKDKEFLNNNLQEAKWFLKSLQTRHDTLLKVATQIVTVQRDFLEHGPESMRPLILADIAEQVDLHESTISRVTNRKYLATPRGLFELKYFFSSHVGTSAGGEVSSTAIRAIIKKLMAEENPRRPLSDSKIAAILGEQNIKVARRTVAKYRESLSIPPSNERKQLI